MTAMTGLQNTVAWMLIVVLASLFLGAVWALIDAVFCHAPSALKPERFSGGASRTSPAGSDAEKFRQPLSQQPPVPRFTVAPSFLSPAPKGFDRDTVSRTRLASKQGRNQ